MSQRVAAKRAERRNRPRTEIAADIQRAGKQNERIIRPDAVLELPSKTRRLFIECEMGTHAIAARQDDRSGATLNKVARYVAFVNRLADAASRQTFYAQRYPDRWRPELVFLVRTDHRAESVKGAIGAWLGIDAMIRGEGRAPWLALAGLLFAVPLVIAFTVRPAVFAGQDRLRVRNPFRTITLPWASVEAVRAGYSSEVLAGGAKYQMWAIPVSLRPSHTTVYSPALCMRSDASARMRCPRTLNTSMDTADSCGRLYRMRASALNGLG